MDRVQKHHSVYKRFETDIEYAARLIAAGVDKWRVTGTDGKTMGALGDAHTPMLQRRLVDDFA